VNVIILGGGVGGIVVANELGQELPNGHKIVLVERSGEHAFSASFLYLMTGERRPEQVKKPLRSLIHPKVTIVQDEVTGIDIANHKD
jgi:NADH dehydrogenase FAD-containing subunit